MRFRLPPPAPRTLRTAALAALLPLALAACDSGGATCEEATGCSQAPNVAYVGSQGNFSDNSGTITRYDLDAQAAEQNAVPNLGGLVQALTFGPDEQLYVLLNFSDSFSTGRGRIDVVDPETDARVAQIDVSTPRGIAFVGSRAYVSNFYANTVTPVDLTTRTAGTPIPAGSNPEGVAAVGNRVYVANFGFGTDSTVTVIDAATNRVTATLDVGCQGPRALVVDAEQEVWVFCTGQTDFETGAVLAGGEAVVLNGATGAVVRRIDLTGTLGTAPLGQDAFGSLQSGLIHVVQGQTVLRFDARTNALAATVEVGPEPIAGVGYDEVSGRLLVGRLDPAAPNPYAVAGFVSVHTATGARVGTFPAGIIPAAFAVRSAFQAD